MEKTRKSKRKNKKNWREIDELETEIKKTLDLKQRQQNVLVPN